MYLVPCLQARVTVVDFLKEQGLYRGIHDNPMRLGISSRSKDVIEPLLKPQWWVACGNMAARSCEAVRSGELEIIPKVHTSSDYHSHEEPAKRSVA